MSNDTIPGYVTVEYVADKFAVDPSTIRRHCQRGTFSGAKQIGGEGGPWLIPLASAALFKPRGPGNPTFSTPDNPRLKILRKNSKRKRRK